MQYRGGAVYNSDGTVKEGHLFMHTCKLLNNYAGVRLCPLRALPAMDPRAAVPAELNVTPMQCGGGAIGNDYGLLTMHTCDLLDNALNAGVRLCPLRALPAMAPRATVPTEPRVGAIQGNPYCMGESNGGGAVSNYMGHVEMSTCYLESNAAVRSAPCVRSLRALPAMALLVAVPAEPLVAPRCTVVLSTTTALTTLTKPLHKWRSTAATCCATLLRCAPASALCVCAPSDCTSGGRST